MAHHQGDRSDIGQYSLNALSVFVDENRRLAHFTSATVRWYFDDGRPVGEIGMHGRVIWRESYCAQYFHIAYGNMLRAMNKKLTAILADQERMAAGIK